MFQPYLEIKRSRYTKHVFKARARIVDKRWKNKSHGLLLSYQEVFILWGKIILCFGSFSGFSLAQYPQLNLSVIILTHGGLHC